jgi:Mrp family chromosome partitioning ATPase
MNLLLNRSQRSAVQAPSEEEEGSHFHTLLYTVFQRPRDPELGGVVVAISSPGPGEGVTFVTRALLRELGKSEFNTVAGVNMSFLRKLHEPTLEAIRTSLRNAEKSAEAESPVLTRRRSYLLPEERRGPWDGSWQYRRDCVNLLRSEFDHTIIECPSLKVSGDLLSVAPFVDGVLLVVEANRTRRDEPRLAGQSIAAVGGKLLGFILNKQTPEMPEWLDQML